jgi:hypothetical protein
MVKEEKEDEEKRKGGAYIFVFGCRGPHSVWQAPLGWWQQHTVKEGVTRAFSGSDAQSSERRSPHGTSTHVMDGTQPCEHTSMPSMIR